MVRKKGIDELHLGIGVGHGIKGKRGKVVVGVDNDPKKAYVGRGRNRRKRRIPGVKLVYGRDGDARRFLEGLIRQGIPVGSIDARYFFENLGTHQRFQEAEWANFENAKRETGEVLKLARQVLPHDGEIKVEMRKWEISDWRSLFKKHGFEVDVIECLPKDQVTTWWGKQAMRESERDDSPHDWPTRVVFRRIKTE